MALENKEMEEYLEAMYRKKQKNEKITTSGIAKELSVSPASVSEMFKKLENKGLVKRHPYKGVTLTEKGEEIGRSVLRKHHLIEDFLLRFGIGRKRAHIDACALEHALSEKAEKAFKKAIGLAANKNIKTIYDLKVGQKAKIIQVEGGTNVHRRAMELGLTEGAIIKVLRISRYGCPIELLVRGATIAIGRGIAEKIYVKVIE